MSITAQGFAYIRELVRSRSGLVLEPGKEYLVEARLRPLAEKAGVESVQRFIDGLRTTSPGAAHRNAIEAMATNETSFFRDAAAFESLRKVILPAIIENRRKQEAINAWCAACSTGQEPYTLAIVVREYFPQLARWSIRIRATDLSRKAVERAQTGRFSQREVERGMPAPLVVKYFVRVGANWQLNEQVRGMVEFSELNLTQAWPVLPPMELILLRNVLYYFDALTRRRILDQVTRTLASDGYLLVGNTETTCGVHEDFERLTEDQSGWHRLKHDARRSLPLCHP